MKGLPFKATYYEVKADIAKVFHGEDSFFSTPDDRPLNFEIELNYVDEYYRRTDGTGVLVVPKPEIGDKLLKLLRNGRIQVEVQSRVVRIFPSKRVPSKSLVETLKRVPYQDPAVDQERDEKVEAVDKDFRVNSLQFGIWARRPTSANSRGLFCTEWDRSYTDIGNAVIRIDFDRKLIRITIGNAELDDEANHILLKFSNVKDMWAGYDYGNPCELRQLRNLRRYYSRPANEISVLCFDLLTPAIFECAWHTRESSGLIQEGSRKTLQRIGSLDSEHAQIAPYSHQIRLTLYQPEDLDEFVGLTTIAGLEYPGVRNGRRVQIDSEKHHYFTSKKLNQVEKLLKSIPFSVAFQVEALLRQGLVHTDNVLNDLWQPINDLYKDYPDLTAELLKIYVQELLAKRPPFTEAFKVLQALCSRKLQDGLKPESDHQNLMSCLHVTFTPTRMTLEGPYGVQSNRVIRKYVGYQDHFLRVDFRDEDRLQYRWDRQVDGETFLKERVGTILKEGFVLAGRRFEFLAYSSSSLRNHTVWFILPFHSEAHGYVCAAAIRKGLGGFDKIAHLPAKCAARIALAFTATDASVEVDQDRRRMIADIEDSTGRKFTDGTCFSHPILYIDFISTRPHRCRNHVQSAE
jgi:RNA-dependent RNA polymerase